MSGGAQVDEATYVAADGSICPFCRSNTIQSQPDLQFEGDVILQKVDCKSCDKSWTDHFSLAGYRLK